MVLLNRFLMFLIVVFSYDRVLAMDCLDLAVEKKEYVSSEQQYKFWTIYEIDHGCIQLVKSNVCRAEMSHRLITLADHTDFKDMVDINDTERSKLSLMEEIELCCMIYDNDCKSAQEFLEVHSKAINTRISLLESKPTPLILAAKTCSEAMCEMLVCMGALMEEQDNRGRTALSCAALTGNLAALVFFEKTMNRVAHEHGDVYKCTPLMLAIAGNFNERAISILAKPEYGTINKTNCMGQTALEIGLALHLSEIVELLAPLTTIEHNRLLLHKAISFNDGESVEALVNCSKPNMLKPNALDPHDKTPLMRAIEQRNNRMVELLSSVSDVDTRATIMDDTALRTAIQINYKPGVLALLDHANLGADIRSGRDTLLHQAASMGNAELCETLVEHVIRVRKNVFTLLCCLKKVCEQSATRDEFNRHKEIYRQAKTIFGPYLMRCILNLPESTRGWLEMENSEGKTAFQILPSLPILDPERYLVLKREIENEQTAKETNDKPSRGNGAFAKLTLNKLIKVGAFFLGAIFVLIWQKEKIAYLLTSASRSMVDAVKLQIGRHNAAGVSDRF